MLTRVAEGWSCPRGTCNMDRVVTMTIDDEGLLLIGHRRQECFLYEAASREFRSACHVSEFKHFPAFSWCTKNAPPSLTLLIAILSSLQQAARTVRSFVPISTGPIMC